MDIRHKAPNAARKISSVVSQSTVSGDTRYANAPLKKLNAELIKSAITQKQTTLKNVPRIVQIENTSRCAFQCIACPHFYQKGRVGIDVLPQVVERLDEILPRAEQLHIVGGGEPFGDRKLEDSVESYARHGVRISTITSLMQLSDRMLNLIQNNFRSLRISYEQTFINANGDVATCSLMPTRSLGNLLDHSSFFDIWNGESMVAMREAYWSGTVPHHCYGCPALMGGFLHRVKLDRAVSAAEFATNRFD